MYFVPCFRSDLVSCLLCGCQSLAASTQRIISISDVAIFVGQFEPNSLFLIVLVLVRSMVIQIKICGFCLPCQNNSIVLNIIPTLYEGYIVSVHRMVMENRPVDPGRVTDLYPS